MARLNVPLPIFIQSKNEESLRGIFLNTNCCLVKKPSLEVGGRTYNHML